MLKYLAAAFLLVAQAAYAAGPSPAVNQDMGCTNDRQVLIYDNASGSIICTHPRLLPLPVASLPACGAITQGIMLMVTDALAPAALAAVVGGGAAKVAVVCNGTSWVVL